ncbi:sigma-54-dependent Fis family transcriptional regulator [Candidatus Poribacteria bacterium]|nr:sigma-54-dependent Fis family transcriptional regulator [Candidatus Poribacteria bacterium]
MSERILVVDDQEEIKELLKDVFERRGSESIMASSSEEALEMLNKDRESFDLVILDYDFGPKMNGLEALPKIKKICPDLPVIILTGKGSVPVAVSAMKLGADDFVEKDFYLEEHIEVSLRRLDNLLNLVKTSKELHQEAEFYRKSLIERYNIVGDSRQIREVLEQVKEVASIPRPVLIRGDRGTGKELIAAAIHHSGIRRKGPFITINCAALAEGLLECELFGQEENAFTGSAFREGRFVLANKGTLFLDEIGNMSLDFQSKILRVIEYQQFERVGGEKTIKVDVRIIAATNTDLEKDMKEGRFREDLYDRLAFETIWVPPLRERKADIEPLCYHFMKKLAEEIPGIKPKKLSPEALSDMLEYDWPGNIRELKYFIERLTYKIDGDTIFPHHLPEEIRLPIHEDAMTDKSFQERMDSFQKRIILSALLNNNWNLKLTAESLKIDYEELTELCHKYNLGMKKNSVL